MRFLGSFDLVGLLAGHFQGPISNLHDTHTHQWGGIAFRREGVVLQAHTMTSTGKRPLLGVVGPKGLVGLPCGCQYARLHRIKNPMSASTLLCFWANSVLCRAGPRLSGLM